MKRKTALNQRLFAWLLTVTLLFVALSSGASWQCLNGTPCPLHCPLLEQSDSGSPASCAASPASHCAKCHAVSSTSLRSKTAALCLSSRCVLRMQSKPEVAPAHKSVFILPLLALPPPTAAQTVVSSNETVADSFPLPRVFYPQRFLRPCLGRAPPVLL